MIRRATQARSVGWIVHLAVACAFAFPSLFVVWRTLRSATGAAALLDDLAAPTLRTILLATAVSVSSVIVGATLAWLLERTDLALRRWWEVVLVVPLVLPSFVGATAFLAGLSRDGALTWVLEAIGLGAPQRFRGFWPAWLLLTSFSYPFVLLPVRARLRTERASVIESARVLGAGRLDVLGSITFPHVRSAVAESGLIVFLYTVSDFGAVQLLGYDTLTRVIYATRQADRPTSFAAATTVLAIAVTALVLARSIAGERSPDWRGPERPVPRTSLRSRQIIAQLVCATVAAVSLAAPLTSLLAWAGRAIGEGRLRLGDLTSPAINSALMGVTAALATVVVVTPVAAAVVRTRGLAPRIAGATIVAGFALPGIVIALALAVLALNAPVIEWFYQSTPLLVAAYVTHFASLSFGSLSDAARAVSPAAAASAQLLEPSRWRRALRIELPIMRPGLVAGGGLVLLATLKELPATLLLAPIGFRTLATEVWNSFEEGFFGDAAVASLALLAVSALLSWLFVIGPDGDQHGALS